MHKYLILFKLLLLFSFETYAQTPKYDHYTTNNGLPSSEVYDVLQDSKGYLWFATDNGVSRFDGYEFKNYGVDEGLLDIVIFNLYEDYTGRLWFSNAENIFYNKDDSIYSYQYNDRIAHRINVRGQNLKRYINKIHIDSTETLTIYWRRSGVSHINKSGVFNNINSAFPDDMYYHYNQIHKLGAIYLPTDTTKDKNSKLKTNFNTNDYKIQPNLIINKHNPVYLFDQINDEQFVIGTSFELILFGKNNIASKSFPGRAISIYKEGNDNMWVGLSEKQGAYCFSKKEFNFESPEIFLEGYSISAIMKDYEGGLWFSTLEDGVFYIPNKQFKTFSNFSNNDKLTISKITQDSKKNIYFLENKSQVYKLNRLNNTEFFYSGPYETHDLSYQKNFLWHISNYGITRISENGKRRIINNAKLFVQGKSHGFISQKAIYAISPTKLIGGQNNGIYLINMQSKDDTITELGLSEKNIHFSNVKSFSRFTQDRILLSTYSGLYTINADTIPPYDLQAEYLGDKHALLGTRIDDIVYNEFDNRYYLASKKEGLLIWDIEKDTVYQIDKSNKLSDNLTTSIYCDDSIVWVGTKNGLNKIVIDTIDGFSYHIQKINEIHGLPDKEINDVEVIDSIVYVATKNGLGLFNYHNIKKNYTLPKTYINSIEVNGGPVPIMDNYQLPHDSNNVYIKYIGLSFKQHGNIRYRYRMHGLDTTWHYTKNLDVRYSKLPYGKYNFEVFAQNEDGIWSDTPASVSFIIRPPFWLTWYFILSLVLLLSIVFSYVYYKRIQLISRKFEDEKLRHNLESELIKSRQKVLIQQMNPHFIFNALNTIIGLVSLKNITAAKKSLNHFSNLMRKILENSQQMNVSVEQEIETLRNYLELERIRIGDHMEYDIIIDKRINTIASFIPTMLIQPFLENSIWHGIKHKKDGIGKLDLELILNNNSRTIQCIITDNGIGRAKSNELNKNKSPKTYKSYGTKITDDRLKIISNLYNNKFNMEYSDVIDNNENICGTRVKINLPLIEKHISN